MHKRTLKSKLLRKLVIFCMAGVMLVEVPLGVKAATPDPSEIFPEEKIEELTKEADKESIDFDKPSDDGTVTVEAKNKYPTRAGVILVTPDKWKLLPLGHAAIVYSKNYVIESVSQGVLKGRNNWNRTRKKVYGLKVKGTSRAQDKKAVQWCASQIGKKYNYDYFNINTRKKFYCSQLIYAAYKDLYGIDLNTKAFSIGGRNPIHPMELVRSKKTKVIYKK